MLLRITRFVLVIITLAGCTSSRNNYTPSSTYQKIQHDIHPAATTMPSDNDADYVLPPAYYTPEKPVPSRPPGNHLPPPPQSYPKDNDNSYIPPFPQDNDADYSLPQNFYTPEKPVPPHPPGSTSPPAPPYPTDNDNSYIPPSWYTPLKKTTPPADNDESYRLPYGVPANSGNDNSDNLPPDEDSNYIYPLYLD